MIEYGEGLKKELRKLASLCDESDDDLKRHIICTTEFRDDFNPCNRNNANNSFTFHTLSIIPIGSSLNSNELTHAITIGNKNKDSMIDEMAYIEILNKLMDPTNKIIFCSAKKRIHVHGHSSCRFHGRSTW